MWQKYSISVLKSNVLASLVGEKGLKDYFKDDFIIGTAIGDSAFTKNDAELLDLVKREFNGVTAENALKWAPVHPKENLQ